MTIKIQIIRDVIKHQHQPEHLHWTVILDGKPIASFNELSSGNHISNLEAVIEGLTSVYDDTGVDYVIERVELKKLTPVISLEWVNKQLEKSA